MMINMKHLQTFESYGSQDYLNQINSLSEVYGLPKFKITGEEKTGKWYKDIFKGIQYISSEVEGNKKYFYIIYDPKNSHYKGKFQGKFAIQSNRDTMGGYVSDLLEEEWFVSENLEDIMSWFMMIDSPYDTRS